MEGFQKFPGGGVSDFPNGGVSDFPDRGVSEFPDGGVSKKGTDQSTEKRRNRAKVACMALSLRSDLIFFNMPLKLIPTVVVLQHQRAASLHCEGHGGRRGVLRCGAGAWARIRPKLSRVIVCPIISGASVAPPNRLEAEDMCIDPTSVVTVTRVLAYSARTFTLRLYGYLSGCHSVTATSY
eukprot:COSAG03_NODE_476_length_7617_cov_79.083400_2_plen_181_part_00